MNQQISEKQFNNFKESFSQIFKPKHATPTPQRSKSPPIGLQEEIYSSIKRSRELNYIPQPTEFQITKQFTHKYRYKTPMTPITPTDPSPRFRLSKHDHIYKQPRTHRSIISPLQHREIKQQLHHQIKTRRDQIRQEVDKIRRQMDAKGIFPSDVNQTRCETLIETKTQKMLKTSYASLLQDIRKEVLQREEQEKNEAIRNAELLKSISDAVIHKERSQKPAYMRMNPKQFSRMVPGKLRYMAREGIKKKCVQSIDLVSLKSV